MLPPDLYPQAIQIGRLLAHMPANIGAVCGQSTAKAAADSSYTNFDRTLAFREAVVFQPKLTGTMAMLTRRLVPFYGRVPDEFRPWVPLAVTAVAERLRRTGYRPDLFATFGEPMSDHLVGLRLKSALGVPWIAHFSDPWVDNSFRRYEFLARFLNMRLERRVVAAADRMIFTSQETLDLVMRKYPAHWRGKAAVLPHSFDPALYPPPVRLHGPLLIRYLGNFYGHRSPVPLFRALTLMLARDPKMLRDVQFELVGQIPKRMQKHPSLRSLPDGLVRLRSPVPYTQSLALMSQSDVLLVIDGPDVLSVFLPSKLIDYLGARVPIFGIVPPGTSAKLLTRLGAPVANPDDPEAVATALRLVLERARARRDAPDWQPWGDPAIISEFDIASVSKAFSRIVHDTVQRNGSVPQ
jgi:glycosyltransferase involved in cell wall biosynthesis